jgi:tricorn protease
MKPGRLEVALLFVFALGGLAASAPASAEPAYFRYPDIDGDRIVVAAEGDLWIAPVAGGEARRITTSDGVETLPQFSPDGKWIAFTGQYDGNLDVYVIPSDGGQPRRLTWHPAADLVAGWTPDGKSVVFRNNGHTPHHNAELFAVPIEGGDPEKLPIGYAVRIDMDLKTGLWAFTRSTNENATWKRYRGGTAPDIWVGDPKKADFRKVTDFDGMDDYPMWHDGLIYFLSDMGGTVNIWSMNADGSGRKRLTDFHDWDARQPSMGPDGRIVFTLAADVHLFDPATGKEHKVDIDLPSDRVLTRVRYPDADQTVTSFDISPDGDRLAVVTRGEIFSVPVKDGVTLPVTRGSGARERDASFDPKGEKIVYVTDATHEDEIRSLDAWGRGAPTVVKKAGESGIDYAPLYSPDGKWVAYSDDALGLYIVPATGGSPRQVDRATRNEIRHFAWSPDSRWIAYAKVNQAQYGSIYVYDTKDSSIHTVTGPFTDDYGPSWDPDGRYLYFLSARAINPILGNQDWDNVEALRTRPYMILLRKDVKDPFADLAGLPPSKEDEKKDADKKDKKDKKKGEKDEGKKEEEAPTPVTIDFDGIADRVEELPVDRGNYFHIEATSKKVFYLSSPLKGFADQGGVFDEPGPDNSLISFDLEDKKDESLMDGVADFALAHKADKLGVWKGKGEFYVFDAGGKPADLSKARVALKNVVIDLDPREEWAQIFYEGWRKEREFFWDAGLGGLDWKGIRDRYATLLPRLANRSDLGDLMGEVIGELNNSHTYVFGGDPGVHVKHVSVGLLGADVQREGDVYKIVRIYHGDPADNVVAPLAAPGVNVTEGEYIVEVNHAPFEANRSFYSYFSDLAGKSVVLTVNDKPSSQGARDVVVVPAGDEHDVRYADWVRRNREYVAQKTGGKIGYIHISDMWRDGLIEFNTWFYPQLDKEGMVVDARWNGGGAVSQMIVERLARHVVSFDRARWTGVSTWPDRVLNGPFVVLTNEFAGSDGDIFPAAIQMEKLAPVIGMRTWGGVIGIGEGRPLVDGGMLTQPEYAWWDPQRGWGLENHGVDPDIVIDNLPQQVARGEDAQLDRAIQEVMRLHGEHPPLAPDFGPVRPRTRAAFAKEVTGP